MYANVIENLYSQVDNELNQLHIYYVIVRPCKGKIAVQKSDQFYKINGRQYNKKTTPGWYL